MNLDIEIKLLIKQYCELYKVDIQEETETYKQRFSSSKLKKAGYRKYLKTRIATANKQIRGLTEK